MYILYVLDSSLDIQYIYTYTHQLEYRILIDTKCPKLHVLFKKKSEISDVNKAIENNQHTT